MKLYYAKASSEFQNLESLKLATFQWSPFYCSPGVNDVGSGGADYIDTYFKDNFRKFDLKTPSVQSGM
jgi:hypothetical protein